LEGLRQRRLLIEFDLCGRAPAPAALTSQSAPF
jgi:hypothetical protein